MFGEFSSFCLAKVCSRAKVGTASPNNKAHVIDKLVARSWLGQERMVPGTSQETGENNVVFTQINDHNNDTLLITGMGVNGTSFVRAHSMELYWYIIDKIDQMLQSLIDTLVLPISTYSKDSVDSTMFNIRSAISTRYRTGN